MALRSMSPLDGSTLSVYREWQVYKLHEALEQCAHAAADWARLPLARRADRLDSVAGLLRSDRAELAQLISFEMGKLKREALAEIDDCIALCEHYAGRAEAYLGNEEVEGLRDRATLVHEPLGIVLLVTPRYAPFWLVFRAAIPALLAGNGVALKHAGAVTQCALAIEELFHESLEPRDVFRTLQVGSEQVPSVIASPHVAALYFCGSAEVGRDLAGLAGEEGKKAVLQLGGRDPFILLDDADLDAAVPAALAARFTNAGQVGAGAKRFVVAETVADEFVERLRERVETEFIYGDPMLEETRFAPLASHELRDRLHHQVSGSRSGGARVVTGCMPGEPPAAFYQASILDRVVPGMPAYDEELFGPVAAIIRVEGDAHAAQVASDAEIAHGASIWSADAQRALAVGRQLRCSQVHVNAFCDEDPGLPCGGLGASGFGRLHGLLGVREFTTSKAIVSK